MSERLRVGDPPSALNVIGWQGYLDHSPEKRRRLFSKRRRQWGRGEVDSQLVSYLAFDDEGLDPEWPSQAWREDE